MRTFVAAVMSILLAASSLSAQNKEPQAQPDFLQDARAAMDEKDLDRAMADACRALEMSPADPNAWLTRAAVYMSLGRWGEAVQDLNRLLELNPLIGRDLGLRLGRCALRIGDGGEKTTASAGEPVTKIVRLREVRASDLASILSSLSRPWLERGQKINVTWDNMNNVLLTGDAKPVESIIAELGRLDTAPVGFNLRFYLMRAADQPPTMPPPAGEAAEKEIAPVIEYLKQVVRYRQFSLVQTGLLRMQERTPGALLLGDAKNWFGLCFNAVSANREASTLRLGDVKLSQGQVGRNGQTGEEVKSERTILETSVQLKDGEVAVLGASRVDGENEALVLVVRCDFVK